MLEFRRVVSTVAWLVVMTGVGLSAFTAPAWACGGLFCQNTPVDQAGERILFATDGQSVTAHVQIQYQGDAKDFSWVVPVPSKPTLGVGSDELFTVLRAATRPQFVLDFNEEDGCAFIGTPPVARTAPAASAPAPTGVTIVEEERVGPYDAAILQSNDASALRTWLTGNGYVLPQKLDPLLSPYIEGKYYFVALKLSSNRSAGDIQPIVLDYSATKPGIPIRLTGVAATNDMDVFVWVLGKQRAVPENYRHAQINEARINWMTGGSNYRDVVTVAMNEAGGQAWVTDYAGDSKAVPAESFDPARFDLDALAQLTEPVAFAEAVVSGGFFGGRFSGLNGTALVAFLKNHIAKPASLGDVDDTTFYRFLSDYRNALNQAQVKVDAPRAIAELREKVVRPYGDIKTMLSAHPYLTAMYTTLSPEEMTQDPLFVFNPELPKVSNVHEAKGLRRCSLSKTKNSYFGAPIEITLSNGLKFLAQETVYDDQGKPVPDAALRTLPAAFRIEQLKSSGGASLIQDNRPAVERALGIATTQPAASPPTSVPSSFTPGSPGPLATPATGFGCAGCSATNTPPRTSEGAGEGLAFALFGIGFLGWRRFQRKS